MKAELEKFIEREAGNYTKENWHIIVTDSSRAKEIYTAGANSLAPLLLEAVEALEKVADPRKRDHKEPDAYTQHACMMNLAEEALASIRGKLKCPAVTLRKS